MDDLDPATALQSLSAPKQDDMDAAEALKAIPAQRQDPREALKSLIDAPMPSEHDRKLHEAYDYYSQRADQFWGPGTAPYIADRIPGANVGASIAKYAELNGAVKRFKAGEQNDNDYNILAQHKAKQDYEANRSTGQQVVDMLGHAPGLAAEFAATGGLTSGLRAGATKVLGEGLMARGAASLAGTAAQTALMPSMYIDKAVSNNLLQDREPLDPRGLPTAYGLAVAQMAVLGVTGKLTGKAFTGDGLSQALGRIGTQAATGPFSQAVADVLTSAVHLDTGFGTVGMLLHKDKEGKADPQWSAAMNKALMDSLQFATFGAAHEIVSGGKGHAKEEAAPVMKAFAEASKDLSGKGVLTDEAGKILQGPKDIIDAIHAKDPNADRVTVEAAMQGLPEGPLRDLGMQMAAQIPTHVEVQGPTPGIDQPETGPPKPPEAQTANAEPPQPVAPPVPEPVKPLEVAPVAKAPEPVESPEVSKAADDIHVIFDKAGLTDREKHVLIEKVGGRTHEDIGTDVESLGGKMGRKAFTRARVQQIEKEARKKIEAVLPEGQTFDSIFQTVNKPDVASAQKDLKDLKKVGKDTTVAVEAEEGKGGWIKKEPEVKFQEAWVAKLERLKESEEYKQADAVGQKAMEGDWSIAYQRAGAIRDQWLGKLKELKKSPEYKEGNTDDRGRLLDTLAQQFDAETAKRKSIESTPVRPEDSAGVQPRPPSGPEAQTPEAEGSQGLGASGNAGGSEAAGNKLIHNYTPPDEDRLPPKTPRFKRSTAEEEVLKGYSLRDLAGKEFGLYQSEAEAKTAAEKFTERNHQKGDENEYSHVEVWGHPDDPGISRTVSKFIAPEEHADVITQAKRSGRTSAQAEELIRQVEDEVAQQLQEEIRAAGPSGEGSQPGGQAGSGSSPGPVDQPVSPPGNVTQLAPGVFFHRGPAGREPGPGSVTASVVVPMNTGPVAKGIIRQRNAEMHQKMERSAETVSEGAKFFDVWTEGAPDEATKKERFLQFTDAIQHVGDATVDKLPEIMREFGKVGEALIAEHEAELKKKGYLQTFLDHYMGQLWTDPANPDATPEEKAAQINSKRSLAGGEAYRKKRSIDSYRDGIEAGLEPVSWNPMDLIKMKADEVDRSIAGRDMFNEAKDQGLLKFQRLGAKTKAGWRMLNDKLARVLAPPETPVKEYFDKQQMEGLEKFADSLGIKQERLTKGLGRAAGQAEVELAPINDALRKMHPGQTDDQIRAKLSQLNQQAGGGGLAGKATVRTKFGTPEEILAHEVGHVLDSRYGMSDWLKDPVVSKELTDLADLRSSGRTSSEYKDYLRSDPERMANLVAAYLHAPELLNKVAPNAMAHLESLMAAHKELQPLRDIKPSLELGQREQMQRVAGPMLTGNYYGPNEVIDAFEKHLSPGLSNNKAFQAFRGFSNAMNMMQLGWSAYHATGTALNAQISAAALGFKMVSHGEFSKALEQIPKALIPLYAPISAVRQGLAMRKDYFAPGTGSPETQQLNEAWQQGGGRARMDQVYRGSQLEAFQKAVAQFRGGQSGKALGVIGRMLPALNEFVSAPVMEHLVPLVKNGVGADMIKYEMSKLSPDATVNQKREVFGKVVDSIDNRFGQMIYDNLFWNRSLKDGLMTAFRSVGWNLGTGKELGGGVKDIPASLKGLQSGEGISHRLAYIGGLTAISAMYGAMIQYLYTGEGPKEPKDLFFPRTGQTNADGTDGRLSLPTYMKDVYGFLNRSDEGPVRNVRNLWGMGKSKLHPAVLAVAEMMNNEDFHGAAIDNPNDPIQARAKDDLVHFLKAFEPFAIRGFREQGPSGGVGQFFGVTKAPQYITKTSEEQRASETKRKVTMTPLAKKLKAK